MRRLELGLTQQQLSEAVGYKSRSAIAKIEKGASEVPLSKLLLFAKALDTTVDRLLEGTCEEEDSIERRDIGRMIRPSDQRQRVAAVILAGGRSTRNLQNIPNQFVNILGKPVIGYCMEAYQRHPLIDDIFIVSLEEYRDILDAYARRYGTSKLTRILPAGDTGVLSARRGYEEAVCSGYRHNDIIVFQESTRPLVTDEMITKVVNAARETGSAIIGRPMHDNVQFYRNKDGGIDYLERERIVDLQSPDAHRCAVIGRAFKRADEQSLPLDESNLGMLMYNLGFPLNFCLWSLSNVKIVRQEDIAIAASLLRQRL